RQNRYFSESFRKQKVKEIEQKLTTVGEISKTYEVSRAAVYKWIYKYSVMKKRSKKRKVIVVIKRSSLFRNVHKVA
ncbi:MAG: transposase, partial [Flavobacteriales bacterium]